MSNPDEEKAEFSLIEKMIRAMRLLAAGLTQMEARFLVWAYYAMQEDRKRANNQIRALKEVGEPHELVIWVSENARRLENDVKAALDVYSAAHPLGRWMRTIHGIGPVLSAGLLAHIDFLHGRKEKDCDCETNELKRARMTKTLKLKEGAAICAGHPIQTCGAIWRFAGQDPTVHWEKGQRRPFNAELKTICWKIGESFVKVSNDEHSFFGKKYKDRKAQEIAKNEAGDFSAQAEAMVKNVPKHKQVATYKQGILPDGHIHSRAKRFAVKMFLAALFDKGMKLNNLPVPKPYVIGILGHAHEFTSEDVDRYEHPEGMPKD